MPVTFLDFVNAGLKRVRVIQGDAGVLATSTVTSTATGLTATEAFTDSSRQTQIDLMLQVSNEVFQEMFSLGMLAAETLTATITLSSNTREYALPTDFLRFSGTSYDTRALVGTKGLILREYPGGLARMLVDQPVASDYRGDPNHWVMQSSATLTLRLDRHAATEQNGNIYNFVYDKRIGFSSTQATNGLPFSETVADALVPVAAQYWNAEYKKEMNVPLMRVSLGRALNYARQTQPRDRYGRRQS